MAVATGGEHAADLGSASRSVLEELGEQVLPDVFAVETCASLWLFDVRRGGYQRLPRGDDAAWAALCGSWQPFGDLAVYGDGTFVVAPPGPDGPALRSRVHPPGCTRCADRTGPVSRVPGSARRPIPQREEAT